MKRLLAISISIIITVIMALLPLTPMAARGITLAADSELYTVVPNSGDGVTLVWQDGRNTVRGVVSDGYFTPAETVTLTLKAIITDGFTYCEEYSSFFPNDSNASVTVSASSCSFSYTFRTGAAVTVSTLESVNIFASANSLPRLEISIDGSFSSVDKENYVSASFNLTLGSNQFASGSYSGTGEIKGRGNTSWGQPKKPYSIKLSSKASLLDIPRTKKYAIVASYSDPSLMRNFITYKSGLALDGIEYTPKCEFVDVYLNGVYNGIYILVERIDIEGTKIDIDEASADNLTGGYLVEKDAGDKVDYSNDLWFNAPFQSNPNADVFTLKAPEPEDSVLATQMLDYLEGYMQDVHSAIMGGTEDCFNYVDSDSWVDFLIMQELSKNIDGNLKTSCYMYKQADDNTLYMTALWDFDFAYGNASWDNASSNNDGTDCPSGSGTAGFMVINSSCPWFQTLYNSYPAFRDAVIAKYTQYRHTLIDDMFTMIDEQAAYLNTAAAANDAKWGNDSALGTATLKSWLAGRVSWLDRQWLPSEAITLDAALNVTGGKLHFTTDAAYGWYGASLNGLTYAISGNSGTDSTTSSLTLSGIAMEAGDTLSFRYRVSSEGNYDILRFSVNGSVILTQSGEVAWAEYTFTAPSDGAYSFVWGYQKDYSVAAGDDCAYVDEVKLTLQSPQVLTGDVNMDGFITSLDALLIMRHALNITLLSDEAAALADFNGDGVIDTTDALLVMRLCLR